MSDKGSVSNDGLNVMKGVLWRQEGYICTYVIYIYLYTYIYIYIYIYIYNCIISVKFE